MATAPASSAPAPGQPAPGFSGRWVLAGILLVGLLLAAGNVWFQRRQTRNAARFWGQQEARTIARSPDISLLLLGEPGPKRHPTDLEVAGVFYPVLATRDISRLGGITHLRRALVLDHFYASTDPEPFAGPWRFALVFRRLGEEVVVLCDDALGRVGRRDGMSLAVQLVQGRRSLLRAVLGQLLRQDAQLRQKWQQVKKADFRGQPDSAPALGPEEGSPRAGPPERASPKDRS